MQTASRDSAQKLRMLGDDLKKDEVAQDVKTFKGHRTCRPPFDAEAAKRGEMCVCELTTAIGRPQSTTSHPSQHPETGRPVNERKVGKWSYYRISDGVVIDMMNQCKTVKKEIVRGDHPLTSLLGLETFQDLFGFLLYRHF